MKKLALYNLELVDDVVSPEQFVDMSLSSLATYFFTDFKKHKPLVIEANTLAKDALTLMQKSHVRMKIVISSTLSFRGVISTSELTERHIIQKISSGITREELTVADMMIPRDKLQAFLYDDITKVTIEDVIENLQTNGLQHCLVLDKDNHHIRGVISASDIARKLKLPVEIHQPISFSTIFKALNS